MAEGERQATVKRADGQREASVLVAEGEKIAQLLRAEGFSRALENINQVAGKVDQKTMSLQYFETLKNMAASPSTKYIFPMEFTSLLKDFVKGQKE